MKRMGGWHGGTMERHLLSWYVESIFFVICWIVGMSCETGDRRWFVLTSEVSVLEVAKIPCS